MTFKKQAAILALSALLVAPMAVSAVLAQDATAEPTLDVTPGMTDIPATITVNSPGLLPEGIEFNPLQNQFLLGSLSQGTISHVDVNGGITPFATSDKVAASVGLQVDAERNRLLAAVSDATRSQAAGLAVFDLQTGSELAYVDLGALTPDAQGHFANDVAVDADGNAYVTDSFAGVIYKVTPDYTASVWLDDPSFKGQYALNGIATNPGGFLIATRTGDLIRIPLDNPTGFATIESEGNFGGGDGITFLDPQTLIVVSGQQNKVMRVVSGDSFVSAHVTGEFAAEPNSATTAAVVNGEVFINYAQFNNPQATTYTLQKVTFTDVVPDVATPEVTAVG